MPKEERHWMYSNMAIYSDPTAKMNSTLKLLIPPTTLAHSDNDALYVMGLTNAYYTGTSFRTGSMNTGFQVIIVMLNMLSCVVDMKAKIYVLHLSTCMQ